MPRRRRQPMTRDYYHDATGQLIDADGRSHADVDAEGAAYFPAGPARCFARRKTSARPSNFDASAAPSLTQSMTRSDMATPAKNTAMTPYHRLMA